MLEDRLERKDVRAGKNFVFEFTDIKFGIEELMLLGGVGKREKFRVHFD